MLRMTPIERRPALAVIAVAALGCGKASSSTAAQGSAAVAAEAPIAIDVAAINALVPDALKAQLVFEQRTLTTVRGKKTATYTIAAPRDWVQDSKMFARMRPAEIYGRLTQLAVTANCDGACEPKDWAAVADRVDFAPRTSGVIRKEARSPGRRVLIAEVEAGATRATVVVAAWWRDGAPSYHVCTATLAAPFRDAAPAFDKACEAIAIAGDE